MDFQWGGMTKGFPCSSCVSNPCSAKSKKRVGGGEREIKREIGGVRAQEGEGKLRLMLNWKKNGMKARRKSSSHLEEGRLGALT